MLEELFVAATVLTGLFGSVASYIGMKAFNRGRDGSLLFAAAGFISITAGTILGGISCVFLNYGEVEAHLVQSTMVGAGLFSIVYSISRAGRLSKAT